MMLNNTNMALANTKYASFRPHGMYAIILDSMVSETQLSMMNAW